jgi:hypothetical protein
MSSIVVDLSISADEYLKHYQVIGASVITQSRDGRSVRFPAKILQPFVTHSGVNGSFEILFGTDGKFSAIERLA